MNRLEGILTEIAAVAADAGREPNEVTLLAVSKSQSIEKMKELYAMGARMFGESKVQEALPKMDELSSCGPACFHFIGRLQSNKAKQVVGHFELIHSVDRLELAQALDKEAGKKGIVQDILIQVSLAGEEQKGGATEADLDGLFTAVSGMKNLRLKGFMTVPPYEENPEINRKYFSKMKVLFDKYKKISENITVLSMGMSDDFRVAIQEGSTMVRIGTALFGNR